MTQPLTLVQERAVDLYDPRHGGPFDRGSADAYYQRQWCPHFYRGQTYSSERVDLKDMTAAEVVAYTAGFNLTQRSCLKKQWD